MLFYDWTFSRCVLVLYCIAMAIKNSIADPAVIENGPCQVLPDGQTTVLNPYRYVDFFFCSFVWRLIVCLPQLEQFEQQYVRSCALDAREILRLWLFYQ